MNFINKLSLQAKLYSLLALLIVGLLVSGGIGYFNMYKMKKNVDSLYFGSYVTVAELNTIRHIYQRDIILGIYELKQKNISPATTAEILDRSKKNIQLSWQKYRYYFKRDYELPYVEYVNEEINKSLVFLSNLKESVLTKTPQEFESLSTKALLAHTEHINTIIEKVIVFEDEMAQYERKKMLSTYEDTQYKLIAIFIFIVASALMVIIPMFHSIQSNRDTLLQTASKLRIVNKKLETASITDALTDLYNRRYFNLVYNRELARSIREQKNLAFMMLDIDYFKDFNDAYGHLEGDATLKAVAQAMKTTLKRPGDYLFRLGGEEFGVLIADTTQDKAHLMAQRIRQAVYEEKIEHKQSKIDDYLSISIGLVVIKAETSIDPEQILQQADKNLYKAKNEGRNRVVVSAFEHAPLEET